MNLLFRELKANGRSLLIWTLALALLNFMMMALFPSFADGAEYMDDFISMLPDEFARMFGLDRLNLTEPVGFYSIEAYFMIILFGGMFAAILGTTMLGKEEDEKTAEFLLAKPVSRSYVVSGKVLAILFQLLLFNLGIGVVTVIAFEIFADGYSRVELARLLVAPFISQLAFAAIGLFLSVFITRRKAAISASIGFVLGLYFFHVAASVTDKFEFLKYFTPFWYMDAADIVHHGELAFWKVAVLLATAVLCTGLSYLLYNKKDIKI